MKYAEQNTPGGVTVFRAEPESWSELSFLITNDIHFYYEDPTKEVEISDDIMDMIF